MRRLVVIGACLVGLAAPLAQAQITPVLTASLTPSPLGIALTVGKWIYDAATKQQVYYVEVAGEGSDPTQARDNGFRLATELALGSLISSETEVRNGRIQRDEIISYSSGFVERFEIVETRPGRQGTTVVMKVWIKRSALADRLLNRSERSGEVDGARASVQLQTLNKERATGDRLLQTVLNDFPKRAFDIALNPADIVRNNRGAGIEIPFAITWNQDYLKSLWTAVEATAQKNSNQVATIGVNSGGLFRGYGGQAHYDDTRKYELLVNQMVMSGPSVLVTIRTAHRQILYSACFNYQELDHQPSYVVTNRRFVELSPYRPTAFVDGSYKMRSKIQIPVNLSTLEQAGIVEMDVVTRKQCPNQ